MELAFATKSLRLLSENNDKAIQKYGNETAEKLIHRLADLRASTFVTELILGKPRSTVFLNEPHYLLDLHDGYNILFCANHINTPILKCGSIDWSKVSRIKIITIGQNDG